jgi:hypothetical protein
VKKQFVFNCTVEITQIPVGDNLQRYVANIGDALFVLTLDGPFVHREVYLDRRFFLIDKATPGSTDVPEMNRNYLERVFFPTVAQVVDWAKANALDYLSELPSLDDIEFAATHAAKEILDEQLPEGICDDGSIAVPNEPAVSKRKRGRWPRNPNSMRKPRAEIKGPRD